MAGLRILFGLFPNTKSYESKAQQLQNDYHAVQEFKDSEELNRFEELQKYIASQEFQEEKKALLSLNYKSSELKNKEVRFKNLSKAKDIKLFYKTKDSEVLKKYQDLYESEDLANYKELESFVSSEEFANKKKFFSLSAKKRFAESDLGHTWRQYQEQLHSQKIKNYQKFTKNKLFKLYAEAISSGNAEEYSKLKEYLASDAFKEQKAKLSKSEYKESEAAAKEASFKRISSTAGIKAFLKLQSSPYKKDFNKLEGSPELEAFKDLETFINSEDFKKQKQKIESKTFKDTEEYQKLEEYKELNRETKFKEFFKFEKSKELANYKKLNDSERITEYEGLKAEIASEEFQKQKEYLKLKPVKRWQGSRAYEKFAELEKLKSSDKIKWYFKVKDSKKFDWFKKWELSFEETFESGNLDTKKWLTRYYWGDKILNEGYSLFHEKHFNTDGDNLEIETGTLKIQTRVESAEGKAWHPEMGFIPKEFKYTSGLINTGKSFRQKYGTFEAKLRIAKVPAVWSAFWMLGDRMTPHIDVIKAGSKASFGSFNGEGDSQNNGCVKKLRRGRFSKDYFIYSLEWTPDRLSWKINGLEVASTSNKVPQEEMYMVFSSGLYTDVMGNYLPENMSIDWVRAYKMIESN